MTKVDFATHLHQPFQLQLDPLLSLWLDLDAVQESTVDPERNDQSSRSISIIFRGPQQPVLPSRTYQLSHPRFGKMDLFLVPFERRQAGMCYKAIVPLATQ